MMAATTLLLGGRVVKATARILEWSCDQVLAEDRTLILDLAEVTSSIGTALRFFTALRAAGTNGERFSLCCRTTQTHS
jgi:hypothetical protein